MNKEFVLFDLREALEELQRTINEIETDDDYGNEEFQVAMSHLYHHLNTAWNSRDASSERHIECSNEDFKQWRRFPKESDLLLD